MSEYTQENRIIAIQTPLGENVLLLQTLRGSEAVSRIFTFQLDMLSENSGIVFTTIVGQRVTITIHLATGKTRYINGFVSRFTQTGKDNRFTHYHMEVVPWLWFLTRNANCRMFQQKTPVEIIKQVFTDLGFSGMFKDKTTGNYETRAYCVQYRETDFNFVSRLMEQYGIFYYFEHEISTHTLVLADAPSAHQPCPNQETAEYDATSRVTEDERVSDFQMAQEFKTGAFSMNDYSFRTPLTDLDVTEPTVDTVANNAGFELYDFPGGYWAKPQGESVAKVRMQEQEAFHLTGQGVSTCGAFIPGYKFDLADHYRKDLNQSYVLTEIQHAASCGSAYYTGQADIEETYENRFFVIPYSVPYRPLRLSPRPVVQGPQSAVVVGPGGEEIHTDKYGRIKVQFFWDREGKADENSSCWIRVSQIWAGKNWGAMWIPRVGQEVIVEFLEGDPDRPLIMGRVYNDDEMPPYPLPDEKTKSTIKSYSSKGGGGFNEFRFEDKKGSEQMFLHAERNQDVRVKADRMVSIGGTTNLSVGKDQIEKIKGDKHLHVVGDSIAQIDGDDNLRVKGTKLVGVYGDYKMVGKQNVLLEGSTALRISCDGGITITSGASFITLTSAGIWINGPMVYINSGGTQIQVPGFTPGTPKDPAEADDAKPGQMGQAISFQKKHPVVPPANYSPQAMVFKSAAESGAPFCDH